jgi:hypothetical protein
MTEGGAIPKPGGKSRFQGNRDKVGTRRERKIAFGG